MAQFSYHIYTISVVQTENVKTCNASFTAKCSNTGARSANYGSKEGISIRQLSFPKQKKLPILNDLYLKTNIINLF